MADELLAVLRSDPSAAFTAAVDRQIAGHSTCCIPVNHDVSISDWLWHLLTDHRDTLLDQLPGV